MHKPNACAQGSHGTEILNYKHGTNKTGEILMEEEIQSRFERNQMLKEKRLNMNKICFCLQQGTRQILAHVTKDTQVTTCLPMKSKPQTISKKVQQVFTISDKSGSR